MLDLLDPSRGPAVGASAPADTKLPGYRGPDRRRSTVFNSWLSAMLDEVDYPMLLVSPTAQVMHANKVARTELCAPHPLQVLGTELHSRQANDLQLLQQAIESASQRGWRRLVWLGARGEAQVCVAVVPLLGADRRQATLLVVGKSRVCEELSVHWFARSHALTTAETEVLRGLCSGLRPQEVAARQGVALSTIRTQVSSIRAKTRTSSVPSLVRKVALLPPLVNALQGSGVRLDAQPAPPETR
jgi:DNA-binding CsgD family transcriptional regulator